jgi:starch-binding outer membrane protein, SusD/RagB family
LPDNLSKDEVIDRIFQERRVELFAEFGHRWYDLKRTGKIDDIMNSAAIVKGSVWQPYQQLFPIPQSEVDRNPNMTQTPEY